jgi:hypothetical protein
MPAWSFSSLTSFETCPKRYYHIKVAKDVTDTPGEAATWGQQVHKHLEDRAASQTPLPDSLGHLEAIVAPVLAKSGTLLVEHQMAITKDLQPTEWFAKDAWCRGIVDIGVVTPSGTSALLLDWKTGKRKPDNDQLMLFAGLSFAHRHDLQEAQTAFVWLKEGKVDKKKFVRGDIPAIWQHFVPRVKRMERAYAEAQFAPKPSGLCARYCPVPRSKCQFSGKP